jgi:histidyl-tRNA synthetase
MAERIRVQPISGFPEWLPGLCLAEQRLIEAIRRQYELYGFTPIETPAVERLEVLLAKGAMQRQIYALKRPEADEDESAVPLALHFDLTVPLARYVAQRAGELVFPFRRYQIQKVWRGERAQRGRFREFTQCDVDIVGRGSLDLIHDAEMPCIIHSTLQALGVPAFQVQVSNRKVLNALLAAEGIPEGQEADVLRAVDKSDRETEEGTRRILREAGLAEEAVSRIVQLKASQSIEEAGAVLRGAGAGTEGLEELEDVLEHAIALGMPPERIRPNFAIARGLDYYTSTVYETFLTGKEDWGSICSGGRYDDLASYFTSQRFPGVGVSIGLTRLFDLLVQSELVVPAQQTPTRVLVTMQDRSRFLLEYLTMAGRLRAGGIPTEVYLQPHPLREQMGYAASKGIPLAVIAGSREFEGGCVLVKDLENRQQESVAPDELVKHVRRKLGGA